MGGDVQEKRRREGGRRVRNRRWGSSLVGNCLGKGERDLGALAGVTRGFLSIYPAKLSGYYIVSEMCGWKNSLRRINAKGNLEMPDEERTRNLICSMGRSAAKIQALLVSFVVLLALGLCRPTWDSSAIPRVCMETLCISALSRFARGQTARAIASRFTFSLPSCKLEHLHASRVSLELGFFFSMSPSFFLPARASLQIPHLFSPAFPLQPVFGVRYKTLASLRWRFDWSSNQRRDIALRVLSQTLHLCRLVRQETGDLGFRLFSPNRASRVGFSACRPIACTRKCTLPVVP